MGEVAVQKKEKDLLWNELHEMEERIMHRAYDIFQENGCVSGKEMDNWFSAERELVWKPAIELKEENNHFELQMAVAGVDPKDLNVEVTADAVIVKGDTQREKKEEKGQVYTTEFEAGSLFRSIQFPKKIDADKVRAEIRNGLLTITAPVVEEAKPREIDIQAA